MKSKPVMFAFRPLLSWVEHRLFIEQYAVHSGDQVSREMLDAVIEGYLSSVDVVGCFDRQGRLIGGYAVAPARLSRWRPRLSESTLGALEHVVQTGLELNFVWLDRALRGTRAASALWRHIARDLGSRKNAAITYSARTDKAGLLRLYETVSAEVLYEGPFAGLPGTYRLYRSTSLRFRLIPLTYFLRLLLRDVGLKRTGTAAGAPLSRPAASSD